MMERTSGESWAISDTGPLISAFQSNSFDLLTRIFSVVLIPEACETELVSHGWSPDIHTLSTKLKVVKLEKSEKETADEIARRIAHHPQSKNRNAESHQGEAQAIVLAERSEHRNDVLLMDERRAREIAQQRRLNLSGFPGALLLATQIGFITPTELRAKLEICRTQGTHYSVEFIRRVFEIACRRG